MSENLEQSDLVENVSNNEEEAPNEDEMLMTLNDVLQYEDELIEDTAAVLGAMNDKICSYSEGYVKRQALYSCLTCIPEAKLDESKRTGVCLACSYHCHDGHDLVELYTKRNFCCDCGNSKFSSVKCNLLDDKKETNELNMYNQNFQGKYCVCHRPYPDPEDTVNDEMIQCIVCEDWFHSRHLGVNLPLPPFAEMICMDCVEGHPFLLHYDGSLFTTIENSLTEEDVDVTESNKKTDVLEVSKKPDLDVCKKPELKSDIVIAKFFPDVSWRKLLCTCADCMKIYEEEKMMFLLDPEDPVMIYEEKGKAKAKEIVEDQGRNMFKSFNRVQLVETIAGYNDLKENLAEFLKKFAENKKVVREEDIREFFDGMEARKKQKTEIPYFCR